MVYCGQTHFLICTQVPRVLFASKSAVRSFGVIRIQDHTDHGASREPGIRAPDSDFTGFISNLEIVMEKINLDKCDFVLLGDLNADMTAFTRNKQKKEFKEFITRHDLTQLITEATRVTETSRTLIDVILVNNAHRFIESGVVPVALSDHYLVYCVLKTGKIKATPKTMEYRSYKNFDNNAFLEDLKCVPWHVIENEEDIDDAVFLGIDCFPT